VSDGGDIWWEPECVREAEAGAVPCYVCGVPTADRVLMGDTAFPLHPRPPCLRARPRSSGPPLAFEFGAPTTGKRAAMELAAAEARERGIRFISGPWGPLGAWS